MLNKTTTGIIFIDVETSYMKLVEFQLRNSGYISPENIIEDWSLYCAAWKYLDNDRVYSSQVDKDDIKNDRQVCIDLKKALENAKMIVGHNADRFDLKKFNTRLIKHNLGPINHKILTLDTLKMAKKHFGFTSNKLDYIAKFLGVGKKMKHEGNPWRQLIDAPSSKVLNHMVEYCKYDVYPLLEGVYLKMRPYIDHPDLACRTKEEAYNCTHCGSADTIKRGTRITKGGNKYQTHQCKDCGGWGSDKESYQE